MKAASRVSPGLALTEVPVWVVAANIAVSACCYGQNLPAEAGRKTAPTASISGRVFNADDRTEPGVWVEAFGSDWQLYRAKTNDKGEYKVSVYAPGRYTIAARPPKISALAASPINASQSTTREFVTFYRSALARPDAEVIDVGAGQALPGLDIRIRRATVPLISVRGRITGSRYSVELAETLFSGGLFDYTTPDLFYPFQLQPDGTFEADVPPGSYAPLLLGHRGGGLRLSPARIDVTSRPVKVVLAVEPMYRIQLRSSFEDGRELQIPCCLTQQQFAQLSIASLTRLSVLKVLFGPDEVYFANPQLTGPIPPGTYSIDAHWPIESYLKTVRVGPQEYSPNAVRIDGRYQTIELVWSAKTAKVHAYVSGTDPNPDSNWYLVIVSPQAAGAPVRRVASVQFAHGQIPPLLDSLLNLPPGKYVAFLVNRNFSDQIWADTQFLSELLALAVQFKVNEMDQVDLNISLVPPERLSLALANAGFDQFGSRVVGFLK